MGPTRFQGSGSGKSHCDCGTFSEFLSLFFATERRGGAYIDL